MTKEEREYARINPDGLTRKQLAERFGVSRGTIHGIQKKRRKYELNREKWWVEIEFVRNNPRLSDTQIIEVIGRLTGRMMNIWWVTRVRGILRDELREDNERKKNEGPPISQNKCLVFDEL